MPRASEAVAWRRMGSQWCRSWLWCQLALCWETFSFFPSYVMKGYRVLEVTELSAVNTVHACSYFPLFPWLPFACAFFNICRLSVLNSALLWVFNILAWKDYFTCSDLTWMQWGKEVSKIELEGRVSSLLSPWVSAGGTQQGQHLPLENGHTWECRL